MQASKFGFALETNDGNNILFHQTNIISKQRSFVGTMGGELKPMDYETDSDEEIDVQENGIDNETTSSRYIQPSIQ